MKPYYQHDSTEGSSGRCVQLYLRGVRRVVHLHNGYESWSQYIIVPRRAMVAAIRQARKRGSQYHDCQWWRVIPWLAEFVRPYGYGGPGRPYATPPYKIASNRRWVVYRQHGGLDV